MKIKYIGQSFGVDSLTDGKIYEATEEDGMYRAVDDTLMNRKNVLSTLFKRIYEDNVIGRINDEQFRMLSSDYNEEQADITEKLPAIEKQMEALKDQSTGAERFVALARKYTNITELTPEILNTMIDKIIIGERESRHSKKNVKQKIRILFKGFGELDDLMCV